MKRSSRLTRSTPLARAPMRRRKRAASETLRIYGTPERREWVKTLPCAGCGVVGFSENAHVCGSEGTSRKGHHRTIAPLCHDRPGVVGCHTLYDRWLAPFDTAACRELVKAESRRVARAWDAHEERVA